MYERGNGKMLEPSELVQIRDGLISSTKDIARTLDYLRTRRDVDSSRLIYLGYSMGAIFAPPALATYEGLQGAILVSGGYPLESQLPSDFNLHPFQFMPHVKLPILQISGVFDTSFPLETSQNPFFEDLGSANKKHILLESGLLQRFHLTETQPAETGHSDDERRSTMNASPEERMRLSEHV
jgi:dienelactone hydrolase